MQGDRNDKSPATNAPVIEISNIVALFACHETAFILGKLNTFGQMENNVRTYILSLITSFVLFASAAQAELELIMVEEHGCIWCERWNQDIGPIYPKTTEGKRAPLRRLDIHADIPSDLHFTKTLTFTPTFVLMDDGQEVTRIEGYPGEDFFWGLLGVMLNLADEQSES